MGELRIAQSEPSGTRRLLRIAAASLAAAAGWFVVNAVHPIGPAVLLWFPTPVGAAVVTAVYWRTARSATLPAATRRFWRHLTVTAALVGVASVSQVADVLSRPGNGDLRNGPVMMVCDAAGTVMIVYALYRLPLGRQTLNDLVRMAMDASTVMVATAVFLWHFQTRPLLAAQDRQAVYASLALTVLALVAVFAVAKVMLTGYTFIDGKGLTLLAVAMLIGTLVPLLQPIVALIDPRLFAMQIGLPAVFFVATWAGAQQQVAAAAPVVRSSGEERTRSFSVLPYTAIAAVDGLLLYSVWSGHTDLAVIASAAVVLTALVVWRQIMVFRDNSVLLRTLQHMATHDPLTGLPNRAYVQRRLDAVLHPGGDHQIAVVLIDLDGFKQTNDTLGHEAGDALLVTVAGRLRDNVRPGDTIARLGGDEFVAVLDGADPAVAGETAFRMIEAVQRPVNIGGRTLVAQASMGIANGRAGDDPAALLRAADIAMYVAKQAPGTTCVHYEPHMRHVGADETAAQR